VRVASVDADIADCVNAGVIMVAAAGNDAHKIDNAESVEQIEGVDYDNYYTDSVAGTTYYHRGATPSNTAGVITVGSVKIADPEGKNFFSNTGPGVDLFAPGESIISAIPATSAIAVESGVVDYPLNSTFKSTKISGTSMAAPQVTGVVACMLEARPEYNQTQVRTWLTSTTASSRLSDSGGTYTDLSSLQGAPNRFLRQPFNSSTAWRFSGS
jgi:subtilisin family serine protease